MSTPPIANQQLKVLEKNEVYEDSDEGFHFAATLVVYQLNGHLYHAKLKSRHSTNINPEDLENITRIPFSAYNPEFSSEFTPVPKTLPDGLYVKKPFSINWDRISQGPRPNMIAEDVLKEARIYELLLQSPHPNIATYLGCQVDDGTITGLCLKKYSHTLMKEVNPRALTKTALRSTLKPGKDYSSILADIENGIRHLHTLGLVHNDINPSNIMLDDDRAIIIDFGSCRNSRESLEDVGRTYGWYDGKVQQSLPENDLAALEEIRIWIGASSEPFQFEPR
jgi:serine/threonine protein kinase